MIFDVVWSRYLLFQIRYRSLFGTDNEILYNEENKEMSNRTMLEILTKRRQVITIKTSLSTEGITGLWCFHTRARQRQDNDKTIVEPVHSYYAFHTRFVGPGVKGIIEMHRFNICLVVVLLWCENIITDH